MPFFSIIIPVYNVESYLCECLDSVRNQSFDNWEAICVDDGSTDGSSVILDEYAAKDTRIQVIHQAKAGVGNARNKALDALVGMWICFLDADDIWDNNVLSIIRNAIAGNDSAALLRFGYKRFSESSICNFEELGVYAFEKIDISKIISMRDFSNFLVWCYVFRRDIIGKACFPGYLRGEDRCFLNAILLSNNVKCIYATEHPLYGYRQRSGSAVNSTPSFQALCDEMDHRLDIMEMIDASGKKVDYRGNVWLEKYFTRQFFYILKNRDKDRNAAREAWRERLPRFQRLRGLSWQGRLICWFCLRLDSPIVDMLVCGLIPSAVGRFCRGACKLLKGA